MGYYVDSAIEELAKREAGSLSAVWLALGVSIGAYMMVGGLFAGRNEAASIQRAVVTAGGFEVSLSAVRWTFILVSLALLAGAAWVSRRQLGVAAVVRHAVGADDDTRVLSGFAYLRKYSFVAWGLAEAVILLGTLLAILTGRALDMLPFAIAGATSLFLLKPETASLLELAEHMCGRAGA